MYFSNSDNLPYAFCEQIGKEIRDISDEIPFEIPDSWEWVRLGYVGDWGSGATPSRTNSEYYNGNIPWLKTGDLNDGIITDIPESISELALEKTSVRLNPVGSILIAMYGATIGKLGILSIPATISMLRFFFTSSDTIFPILPKHPQRAILIFSINYLQCCDYSSKCKKVNINA